MRRLRSLLFSPGNVPKMLAKAETCREADALVPDLEDSVAVQHKVPARQQVASWLAGVTHQKRDGSLDVHLVPRVNELRSGLMHDDLSAVVIPGVDAVTIGKVDSGEDVREIADAVSAAEARNHVDAGSVRVVPWIETALGVVNAYEICRAHERVVAVAFGGDDYRRDMELTGSRHQSDLTYPRHVITVAAKAARVEPLDTPWTEFHDLEGLADECSQVTQMGFTGKFCIHPSSVAVVNRMFTPSDEAIARAQRIVDAFELAAAHGRGSTSLDGEMIDIPIYRRARSLLDRALLR